MMNNQVIDCHVHGNPDELTVDPQKYVQSCRRDGISAIVLIEPLDRLKKAMGMMGDFIIPVAWISMDEDDPSIVDKAADEGCKGIKFIASLKPYGDEKYLPLYERVLKNNMTAVFHTGYLGKAYTCAGGIPANVENMRAMQVDRISRYLPDLRILMAHFSNPWWEEAWKVSLANENVYVDLSGGTAIFRSMDMWTQTFAPNGIATVESMEKLCFGSDIHFFRQNTPERFKPYMDFYETLYKRTGIEESVIEKIRIGNVKKIFNL